MSHEYEIVKQVVLQRRTEKVIARLDHPVSIDPAEQAIWDAQVADAVATAGLAPFHYDRGVQAIPEPWRVHFLDLTNCRQVARNLGQWIPLKESNKIPGMLAACGCTLLVTWLPQFRSMEPLVAGLTQEKQLEIDDEHLAATAAMVQNLLLLLTAAGLGTYWSSGGVLGGKDVFRRLGIGPDEQLLAAIFVEFPSDSASTNLLERIPGKNRSLRTPAGRWFSIIDPLQ